jgi:hypothetical protein
MCRAESNARKGTHDMRRFELPPEHKLDKIVSLTQAESISGLSVETWKRVHPDKLIQLSPRRIGVRCATR